VISFLPWAANRGDSGANVPARPVRFRQRGYVPPMSTFGCARRPAFRCGGRGMGPSRRSGPGCGL